MTSYNFRVLNPYSNTLADVVISLSAAPIVGAAYWDGEKYLVVSHIVMNQTNTVIAAVVSNMQSLAPTN